ncbi:MAG: hypothetical protein LBT20_07600 [Clostridiales bacterium]|jgi:F0F1-type ATP synthase membrane subunit b/b'|nr:hypothetical protein [Clostridiales bacterium]
MKNQKNYEYEITQTKQVESNEKIVVEYEVKPTKPKSEAEKIRTDAQRVADKRYAQKIKEQNKYITFTIKLFPAEVERIDAILKSAKMSRAEFVRRAAAYVENGTI